RPAREDRKSHKPVGRRDDQLLGRLKAWRNSIVDREHIAPVVVANNQLLKAIASAAPQDLDALRAVDGIRNWQIATYGARILEMAAESANSRDGRPANNGSNKGPNKGRRRRRRHASQTQDDQGE
ncbi:MAG: hypothetical protein GXP62_11265, partial [Oligoflexia bacterium]|nr:hypothetical protein [Oligoflexia bacterium]